MFDKAYILCTCILLSLSALKFRRVYSNVTIRPSVIDLSDVKVLVSR